MDNSNDYYYKYIKYKYIKYKQKYLYLKNQFGGALPQYVEHGIKYNLNKFISILSSGAIVSKKLADKYTKTFLQEHMNATNENILISVSEQQSECSETYSKNGITFIIDTTGLVDGGSKKGQLPGERYVQDIIPLANIKAIFIPEESKDKKLNELDLCTLQYGSASIQAKMRFLFGDKDSSEIIQKLIEDYNNSDTLIRETYTTTVIKYNLERSKDKKRPLSTEKLNIIRDHIQKKILKPLNLRCNRLYIDELNNKLGIDINEMTLVEFINYYMQMIGLNIPIVNSLLSE